MVWESIQKRHDALLQKLTEPSITSTTRHQVQKELNHLHILLEKKREIDVLEREIKEAQNQLSQTDDIEMIELYQDELKLLGDNVTYKQQELDFLLAPPSEHDNRSVYLEIRAGTGGQEAALFAGDLLKMYTNYALAKHWKVSIESSSGTDLGGYREVVLFIKGKDVYGHLKYESGVHRVQRVPSTETQGRVHTSTATVAVLPEAEEVEITIDPGDLRIDVYRSSGAGGQHVNTTDSAVRITHLPTGLVVTCQDERSQHKNKAKAMKLLKSRLLAAMVEKQHAQMSRQRKEQVGTGARSEKVRTYNFPQNRVTDHQVNLTLNKLHLVMEGDIEEIVQQLRIKEQAQRREEFLAQFK